MKTLLFLTGSLFCIQLSAQINHPFQTSSTNPNWSEAFWIGPGDTPYLSWYEINADTVMGAQTYSKVDHFYTGGSYYEGAIRENGSQQIFFIPKDSVTEMLIYDFSKQLNDTLFNIWCNNFGTWKEDTLVINSHDSLLLNGNYYDHFYLQRLGGPGGLQWIESIGSSGDLLRHMPYLSVSGDNYLTCFHNNTGTIYTTSQPFGWTGSTTCYLGYETFEFEEIKVYPNPSSDYLQIPGLELVDGVSYEILNTNGQILQKGVLQSDRITINSLNPGLFLIRISSETNKFLAKFIKN
jgi:hypothetical protein